MKHLLVGIFLVLSLTGCQILPYVNPKHVEGQTAVLRGTSIRRGFANWEEYVVDRVDGRKMVYLVSVREKIVLSPGRHRLEVKPAFYRMDLNLGVGPRATHDEIEFIAESGKEYEFGGRIDGLRCVIWIVEKGSGRKVVEQSTPDHHKMMVSYPIYIPVSR